jgi:hypothetical protein
MNVTQQQVEQTVAKCEQMLDNWKQGRVASPSDKDYVIAACETLGLNWVANEERVNALADQLCEDAGETYVSLTDVAVFALTGLQEQTVRS